MEDLAYLYLALNEEVERAQRGFEVSPAHSSHAWAPPISSDLPIGTASSDRSESATMQSPDLDFECAIYPSFYW